MAATIEFRGQTGQAVQELDKVARIQKKVEDSTRRAKKAADEQSKTILALRQDNTRLGRTLEELQGKYAKLERTQSRTAQAQRASTAGQVSGLERVKNLLGLIGGFVSAGAIFRDLAQGVRLTAEKRQEFEKTITPLLSLGDNVNRIRDVKAEVLSLSSAMGIAAETSAAFLFDLQSSTGGLSDAMRTQLKKEAIELSEVTGTDLPTSLRVLAKTMAIYGDEVGSANEVQNKLLLTAEKGVLTFGEMATLLPDVLPAAKAFGFSMEEVLGALVTATQTGGKTEKTFTGVRNIFLRLENAQKAGIKTQGTFLEQMEQLSQYDGSTLKQIFGDEAVSVAASLAQNTANLRQNIEGVASAAGDIAQSKIFTRLGTDAAFRQSRIDQSMEQAVENAMVGGEASPAAAGLNRLWLQTKLGVRENLPGFMRGGMIETISTAGNLAMHGLATLPNMVLGRNTKAGTLTERGAELMADQFTAGGNAAMANATLMDAGLAEGDSGAMFQRLAAGADRSAENTGELVREVRGLRQDMRGRQLAGAAAE